MHNNMIKTKKYTSYIILIIIGLGFGMGLTYLNANYVDPSNTAPSNNTPAPITTSDVSGDSPFVKIGKLGIYTASNPLQDSRLNDDALVVAGQTSSGAMSVSGSGSINSEIPDSGSTNHSFIFGNSMDTNLWQTFNGQPRKFAVNDYTKTARIVVGSSSASPANYNLYVDPSLELPINIGYTPGSSGPTGAYCYLTADDLKNKGCPYDYTIDQSTSYPITSVATYMQQIIPGTGSEIVARCYVLTPYITSTGRNHNRCY